MNNRFPLLLLCLVVLTLSACQNEATQPTITLRHDAANLDSPSLPGGTYEASARFSTSDLTEADEGTLEAVEVYIQDLPNTASVKIYSSQGGLEPSTLIYESSIIGSLQSNAWNTHELSSTIVVDATMDLWVTVAFSHVSDQRTIGCDPGPAVVNGDWLFDAVDNQWQPLRIRTNGGIDINWNIRARVLGAEE
ncbi:MAG: hypothetical protein AAF598_18960 [Bacteroidota bacterium]